MFAQNENSLAKRVYRPSKARIIPNIFIGSTHNIHNIGIVGISICLNLTFVLVDYKINLGE